MEKNLFNITEVSNQTNFWLVRTKKGLFFDEYYNGNFIALGWNYIDENSIASINEKILKDNIISLYKTKIGTSIINKSNRFINEMKSGDIVMIPSANNAEILFAQVGDYFESDNTVEEEQILINAIDSKIYKDLELVCPYKKRRKIKILKLINGNRLNPNLYKPLISRHGISSINEYAHHILSSIYNFFSWNNDINIVINVEKKTGVGAKPFSKLIYNISDILTLNNSEYKVVTKSNVNSPGDIIISILNQGKDFLTENWLIIFLMWGAISGIKFGIVELPSLIEGISKFRKDKVDIDTKKLDLEIKKYDFEQRKLLENSCAQIESATSELDVDQSASSTVLNINEINDV